MVEVPPFEVQGLRLVDMSVFEVSSSLGFLLLLLLHCFLSSNMEGKFHPDLVRVKYNTRQHKQRRRILLSFSILVLYLINFINEYLAFHVSATFYIFLSFSGIHANTHSRSLFLFLSLSLSLFPSIEQTL